MATVTRLVDDLDPTIEAAETVSFALDGVTFEIDLSEANAGELRELLAVYVAHARRTGGRAQRGRGVAPVRPGQAQQRERTKVIRLWAKANGFDVTDRGRIPVKVLDAYGNRDAVKPEVIMKETVGVKPGVKGGTAPRIGAVKTRPTRTGARSTSRRPGQDSVKD